ncbi:U6 snRNA-associated Sm-like protein LSm1 isoform X1 [Nycticebus coucang]|uniref:U6 snRNA-associated Sm-like protein LSm1 isoform X1 n=1 Tax=Nycticebus coucang TaxID=9470 RepID=UPI00234DB5E8|nr:U6 snRNA-associated Sm-like protein LSm1 isoform X1 [Nycticebus coucang]
MSRDRTTSRPFLRTCTRSRKWVGMIWRSFRWALAVESRGRSAGPGRDSCPGPISAATGIRGRKFGTRWLTAALFQNELYARHRQPHRGHRHLRDAPGQRATSLAFALHVGRSSGDPNAKVAQGIVSHLQYCEEPVRQKTH